MEIRKLNMLRGMAALTVVISHLANTLAGFSGMPFFSDLFGIKSGDLGVMLFFMLSGFLMAYLYLYKPPTAGNVRSYFVARLARVIPLYLGVVVMSYALSHFDTMGVAYNIPSLPSFLAHLFMLSGVSVLWTVPTEIHFYILFLFFWWLYSRCGASLHIMVAALFSLLYFFDFPDPGIKVAELRVQVSLLHTLPFFLIGISFGYIYRRWQVPACMRRNGFVLGLLLMLLLYPGIFRRLAGFEHQLWNDPIVMAIMALSFFCIVFLVPDDNALMSNWVGDFLGRISYSLYLLHWPLLMLLLPVLRASPYFFVLAYGITSLLVSWLSFRLIENPSRLWIRNLAVKPVP